MTPDDGVIASYLGVPGYRGDLLGPTFDDLMSKCLAEQGFEYFPVVVNQDLVSEDGRRVLWMSGGLELYSLEWHRRYGYGFSTELFNQEDLPSPLVGRQGPSDRGMDESPRLVSYMESLSPEERQAFFEIEPACHMSAIEELRQVEPTWEDLRTRYWAQEWEDLEQAVLSDRRYVDRMNEVLVCVEGAGFDSRLATDAEFFERQIDARLDSLGPLRGTVDLSPDVIAGLAKLQDEEIGLARAVLDCGEHPTELQAGRLELLGELLGEAEEQFLEEHLIDFERLRDDLASG